MNSARRSIGFRIWERNTNKALLVDSRLLLEKDLEEVKIIGKKGEKILVWKNYPTGAKPVWIQQKNLETNFQR